MGVGAPPLNDMLQAEINAISNKTLGMTNRGFRVIRISPYSEIRTIWLKAQA
jgi:hypothetical protein